jgi:glucuronate isomerase
MPRLNPDRLLPADPRTLEIARALLKHVETLPIISPHGHTDPAWFAEDEQFPDPAQLLIVPDHYLLRMLHSQGVSLEQLGVKPRDGGDFERDGREIWRRFAANYHLFHGTPTRIWMDWVLADLFAIAEPLNAGTADLFYDRISAQLAKSEFRPRALFDRFGIEVLATTEGALDPLAHHAKIRKSGWKGKVITTFRPDPALDPDNPQFQANLDQLEDMTGEDCQSWKGYLAALANRRAYFRDVGGATATDHGHPTAATADLSAADAEALFLRVRAGKATVADHELFRGQMLTEMAAMSVEDGMVMQLHPGSLRNYDPAIFTRFGPDKGADIPASTEYVRALRPLLNRFGNHPRFSMIVFTLDETAYARELAPLAGLYPALKLGPAWWFHDSPEGIRRFREQTTETAGFYNGVGFNDDTRAFLSIPARHNLARRMDCGFLARLVAEHRMEEEAAVEIAIDLTYRLAKRAYRL